MNKKAVVLTFVVVVFISCLSFAEGPSCSAHSIAGDWGFTTSGFLITQNGAVPVSAVGRLTQDAAGNAQGTQVRSLGGQVARETFTGTISVNRNCTARYIIYVYDEAGNLARTSVLDAIFVENSSHVRVNFESITLPNGASLPSVLTIEGNKLSPKG